MIASENLSDVSENQVSYEDLQRQLAGMKQLLEETKAKIVQLEAEVKKVGSHASNLSQKCENLENRIFKLHEFISDEDMAFCTGFPSFGVFMATEFLSYMSLFLMKIWHFVWAFRPLVFSWQHTIT